MKTFRETQDKDNLSMYVFTARMFDWTITEELQKGIEEENIESTRHIENPKSIEVMEENGEILVIAKFERENGCVINVCTHFQKNDNSYNRQSISAPTSKYYNTDSEPRIVTSQEDKFFIFSYEKYGTISCINRFDDKNNQHECRLFISKE